MNRSHFTKENTDEEITHLILLLLKASSKLLEQLKDTSSSPELKISGKKRSPFLIKQSHNKGA